MRDLCPTDGRHHGWAGVRITIAGISRRPPFVHYRRFRLCAHPDHHSNFLRCWPGSDDCTRERDWGWIWMRCMHNGRRASFPTRLHYLCDSHVRRVRDAMCWVSD